MNIPTIGGARGIFEIFVPGTFLLLNLGLVVYLFPFIDDETKRLISAGASSPVIALVIAVVFGYLIGVLLRLFRTSIPDRLSAAWHRRFYRHARRSNGEPELWISEQFPYIGWIGEECRRYLPPKALDFYNKTWAPRSQEGQNREFFNFCKIMMTSSADERSSDEIYCAEAFSRYISGMFYALVVSISLMLVTVILRFFVLGQVMIGMVIILCAYLIATVVIIKYFRFMRIKEVGTVFAASFKHRCLFGFDEGKGKTASAGEGAQCVES